LISYIAPGAPATRRAAMGDEPYLRPEIGFTPAWYRQHVDIDFGERFHTDPAYRRESVVAMRRTLQQRFPGTRIGGIDRTDSSLDLLTGTYGACSVAAIYGVPIIHSANNWPTCDHLYLTDAQLARLEPPDLGSNPHFCQLMDQVEWIADREGVVEGFINWQGVLNNAHRLRGEALFLDVLEEPEKASHLFACVAHTMIEGIRHLHERQRASGVEYRFVTVSNCLVNLVSPRIYQELLLPFDQQLAAVYGCIGIHNCAWNATPYLESYVQIRGLAYLDMGLKSDLAKARQLFPDTRRALMYTPMDAVNKSIAELDADCARIFRDLGPCDLVVADLDAGTADSRVIHLANIPFRKTNGRSKEDSTPISPAPPTFTSPP
jgi:hypothetical protein